jgi:aldehyde:ferredoxin oxidoreductase
MVRDSAIQCSFAGLYFGVDLLVDLLEAITGHLWPEDELVRAGERILNLERLLNVREGVDRNLDRLPNRLLTEPLADGPKKGSTVPLEDLKDAFYEAAGWDKRTGHPSLKTLERLDLDPEALQILSPFLRKS